MRFTRAKDVKTTQADISSCHRGEVLEWQSHGSQPDRCNPARLDDARRCDGYGSHANCDLRSDTALALEALYNPQPATASELVEQTLPATCNVF